MPQRVKKDLLKSPRGTRDLFGDELSRFDFIRSRFGEIASYYGFQKIQTPHIEHSDLFTASLGEATDIVEKQMYTFRTRGGDQLTLRPEGTIPAVRAYFENGMQAWPQPVMLYYSGSYFRHESPQRGRFREFGQVGLEVLGDSDAIADATVIRVADLAIKEMGISAQLELNTLGDKECRPGYRKELSNYYRKHFNYLCKDCKRRFKENPLRLLDCKENSCLELKKNAPQMLEYVCKECKDHFKAVLDFMDSLEIPYLLNPYLVRGLDYYTRTVFEFVATLGGKEGQAENAAEKVERLEVGGGGRYDYLAEILAGKSLPAAGCALGVDRLSEVLREGGVVPPTEEAKVFLIQLGDVAKRKSLALVEEFRKAGLRLAQSLAKDSIRGQLRVADKLGVEYSIILGQKEAMDGTVILRDMSSGIQETLPLPKLIERLKNKIYPK
ncbi:MAG: histidine--tRNA ligase [Patescibacteria group bacterium]